MSDHDYSSEELFELLKKEREANEKLRDQLNLAKQGWSGNWSLDLSNNKVEWDNGMYHLLAVDEGTDPNMNHFRAALPPPCLDKLNGALNKIFLTKQDYDFEHMLAVNDKLKYSKTQLKPIVNEHNQIVKVIGKLIDITASKSSQKEFEKLSMIASNTSNGVIFLDLETKVEWVNSAFTITTGFRKEEVQGTLFDDYIIGLSKGDCCKDIFEKEFRKTTTITRELKFKTKKGANLWVVLTINAILDYQLNPESYIVIVTDITDRKLAEELLAKQNSEITASINYAKRIQEAILPSSKYVNEHFKDSFILYIPRDIVAGDFYWLEETESYLFFAVADCTGHGVPGAMVSVVCHNALNRSIKEFKLTDTGQILDKVRELVLETFDKGTRSINDGMDISLISVDKSNASVKFSGANNSAHVFRKGTGEIEIIKADRQPVGKFDYNKPFKTHLIELNSGDILYLFSDGYADQFGGPNADEGGKKYMKKRLVKLLTEVGKKEISKQKDILERELLNWKGELDQTDDVLLAGIKF